MGVRAVFEGRLLCCRRARRATHDLYYRIVMIHLFAASIVSKSESPRSCRGAEADLSTPSSQDRENFVFCSAVAPAPLAVACSSLCCHRFPTLAFCSQPSLRPLCCRNPVALGIYSSIPFIWISTAFSNYDSTRH